MLGRVGRAMRMEENGMSIEVREMVLAETPVIMDYF